MVGGHMSSAGTTAMSRRRFMNWVGAAGVWALARPPRVAADWDASATTAGGQSAVAAAKSFELGPEVRAYRYRAMRALMEAQELDALAFLRPDFCFYASNMVVDVQTWERPVLAVVPREGQPFMVMNELSTNSFRTAREAGRVWIEEGVFYSEHPRIRNRLYMTPQWPVLVAELLASHGLGGARIGTDGGSGLLDQVARRLHLVRFTPILEQLKELRFVKHAEEIAVMRECAAFADWGMEQLRRAIRPGRMIGEMDYTVAALMAEEAGKRYPGQSMVINVWTVSGPDSALPHGPHGTGTPPGSRIEKGHVMIANIYPRFNGLCIENERTLFCGKPTEAMRKAYEVEQAAQAAAREQMVAGNPVCAPDEAALAVIEKAGYGEYVFHRTGHAIGINGHEFPEDMAFNRRPLRENETFSCEPMIAIYGLGGFRIDDTMVVGAKAPICLPATPRDLNWAVVSA